MKRIAILTGGDSVEYDISIQSAKTVKENLDNKIFDGIIINLKNNIFKAHYKDKIYNINYNDFSFIYNNEKIVFDIIFIVIHGAPAENGKIQKYFDKLTIPYTACDSKTSNLTFNKYKCNKKVKELGFDIPNTYLYSKHKKNNIEEIINKIKIPCFVKPNESGSSYGISKIKSVNDLTDGINNALKYSLDVVIEEAISGIEVTCGVFFNTITKTIHKLPITEIRTKEEFFNYKAKYEGKSQEITPAKIHPILTKKIHVITKKIYENLSLKGLCRIDYIIRNNTPYVIEINTIPGLSEKSIIPQQIKAAGLSLEEVFTMCLLQEKN